MQYPLPSIQQPQPLFTGGQASTKAPWYSEGGTNTIPGGNDNFHQNPYAHDLNFRLQQVLGGGAFNDAAWLTNFIGPQYQDVIQKLLAGTSTGGAQERARGIGQSVISNQTALGRRQAAVLGAQGGSPALQQGVMDNAINQGRTQANQIFAEESDPQKNLAKQLQILMQGSNTPALQMILKFLGMGQEPQKEPSLFQNLVGAAGTFFGK